MTKKSTPIPPGYKLTKIGVLPVEWEVVKLKQVIKKFESGVSVNGENRPLEEGEIGVLKVSAVSYGSFDPTAVKAVIEDDLDRVRTNPKKGQIIISRANTPDLVGASAYVHDNYSNLFLPDKLWQTVTDEEAVDNRFLFASLQTERTKERTKNLATGSSGSMKNISKPSFLSIQIPLPPLPQQQKIAQILSTWDQAITTQTQLIDAKKEQKRGLMQRLLTGAVRLPGFEGEWEVKKLSELAKIQKGEQFNKRDLGGGQYPVYSGGVTPSGFTNKFNSLENTIAISEGGNSCGFVHLQQQKFWSGGHCYTLVDLRKIDFSFLFYQLKIHEPQIMRLRVGSGLPNIQKKDISKFKVSYPPLEEQTAIATILTTADREIHLLETRLTELREQKRGLMQRLLTGQVRVITTN